MPRKSGWVQKCQNFSEILPRLPDELHKVIVVSDLAVSSCELGLWRSVLLIISVCSSKLILAACIPWALKYECRSFMVKKKKKIVYF